MQCFKSIAVICAFTATLSTIPAVAQDTGAKGFKVTLLGTGTPRTPP